MLCGWGPCVPTLTWPPPQSTLPWLHGFSSFEALPHILPAINMYKSLDSRGHQAQGRLGRLSPRLQDSDSQDGCLVGSISGHRLSGSSQLAQDPAELLSAVVQFLDPVHHVLGSSG